MSRWVRTSERSEEEDREAYDHDNTPLKDEAAHDIASATSLEGIADPL